MDEAATRYTGRLVLGIGAVAVGSAACLGAYFAVGGPLGTLNDIGNATIGVLSATLAWRLRGELTGQAGAIATVLAVAGAGVTVAGSALVISGTTGFMLAGLVSSVGFAGIGAWLVVANRQTSRPWPRPLRRLGIVAGSLMALGIVVVPAIAQGVDDFATAPGWVWLGFTGWLGIYVVYPAWAVWAGLREMLAAGQPATPATTSAVAATGTEPAEIA